MANNNVNMTTDQRLGVKNGTNIPNTYGSYVAGGGVPAPSTPIVITTPPSVTNPVAPISPTSPTGSISQKPSQPFADGTVMSGNPQDGFNNVGNPPQGGGSAPVNSPSSPPQSGSNAGTNGSSGTETGVGAGTGAGAGAGVESVDSYEQFLINQGSSYGNIRDTTINHVESTFNTLVNAINAQKATGMAMAEEHRNLLLSMSEEQRNAIYAAAEAQRVEEEKRAEIARERMVVDARSSYEQNLASYGAKAEAMGSMGLTGSGYSDYLNTKAYAQQRADTQNANAQAETAKREARYAENQARMQADSEYFQNKFNAESQYADRVYEIDTTYNTNMAAAEKDRADGIFNANMSYEENILKNDADLAKHRYEKEEDKKEKADAIAAQEQKDFETLLAAANSGMYTKEQLEQFVKDKGLSEEHANTVLGAADGYNTKNQAQMLTEILSYVTVDTTDREIQDWIAAGYITGDGIERVKEQRATAAKDEVYQYLNGGDISTAQSEIERFFSKGIISKDTYQAFYYDAYIKNCDSATTAAEALQIEADLNNLKNAGKLTTADYNNAISYLYHKFGSTLAPNKYSTDFTKTQTGGVKANAQNMVITIGGKSYEIATSVSDGKGSFADSNTSKVLSKMIGGNPSHGNLAMIGDTIYVYRSKLSNGSGWVAINLYSNGDSQAFYDAYKQEVGYQPAPSAPKSEKAS